MKRFPKDAPRVAFLNLLARPGAGEDAPPEHPFLLAIRDSDDPAWINSFYAASGCEGSTEPA